MREIKRILIANRGEIASRIIKACRKADIETVAVYSDADRTSPHVTEANYGAYIGPPAPKDSYLNIENIIEVSKEFDVDAIHPGYGFLSEREEFAQAVEKAGIIFIGPSSKSIAIMGNKLRAKEAVKKFDIPLVPGTEEPVDDIDEAVKIAGQIGFPVLIKAAAGGGGKGMRIVYDRDNLKGQVERAVSEARSSFGDGAVFIEKYISAPKHIEFQILSDAHGNFIHLFERECSIQRRHQKVIEEAPSPIMDPHLRRKMGEDAINVARACQYKGAGTVEFIMDENKNYYFLEMNTRLQVEHPITEIITGTDLVLWQIKIAEGIKLTLSQEDLSISGHAIELRVYAEDAFESFAPSTGKLTRYRMPEGNDIRVDNGYRENMTVPIYYDPMLAKLIVHGSTREEAIQKMKEAISFYEVEGVETTLPFGMFVMNSPEFRSGKYTTAFVKDHFTEENFRQQNEDAARAMALFSLWHKKEQDSII